MNAPSLSSNSRNRRGMMLVECLVYLAVSSVLVGLGIALYLRCLDSATNLERNADDIAGALSLGERWRADLRHATANPHWSTNDTVEFVIPQNGGDVLYRFADDIVWRRQSNEARWTRLLNRVADARWSTETRSHVIAWHLDLEMKTRKRHARVRPLFSFIGVAGNEGHP